ncbi:MAG TPA: lactate racemase domain-containing protein [Ktedonobacterales bacterium]
MRISFDVPEDILHTLLDPVALPPMARVRHHMRTHAPLPDVGSVVAAELRRPEVATLIQPGQRIAIGVGSRGIGRLPEIVAALVAGLRAAGAEPFIFPAMGSHGGATAEGQREVLAHLGITEERVGAPVRSRMETVTLGQSEDGAAAHLDGLAAQADGIVFVARVKPHTAFRGPYESGLAKMIAIGLGKQAGAAACHAAGFGHIARVIPALARISIARAPIRFGLAVLENAHDQPYRILAVPAERIMADEPALLDEARLAMPRIPFDAFDVLVIDEIGKNISGDGADPNITGRYPTPDASGGPVVNKQVVLDLTSETGGNANGLGTADFTTVRAARKLILGRTYPNALTSTVPRPVALPMVLPSDRMAIAAAVLTCNAVGRAPRVVRIPNTLRLDELWISAALVDEARRDPQITIAGEPAPLPFDDAGNLPEFASQRGPALAAAASDTDAW